MIVRGNILLSVVLAVCLLLTGCSPQAVREAQRVVAEADSLHAERVAYTDSVTMAEAYNTLDKWQYIYPTDYARACYYYGRLLRNNDDPVAAMQVFINATHTNTRDYHILARTYSNMGSICHLANEYQLAYDMYSRSADLFLQNSDTTRYYYALNDMAFELAMQGKKDETLLLVDNIEQHSTNQGVAFKVLDTKAELYLCTNAYDSAIYYATLLANCSPDNVLGFMILSQSYSYLGEKDSAVYYAKQVIRLSHSIYDLGNAYYMLTNDNTLSGVEEVREMAATRADILLEVSNQQSRLSQSTQLLQQELDRKPDLKWLYSIVITLIVIFVIVLIILRRTKKYRAQKHAQLEKVKEQIAQQTNEQLTLIERNNDLRTLSVTRQQDINMHLNAECDWLRDLPNDQLIKQLKWNNYESMCSIVNSRMYGFIDKLILICPSLKEREMRMCVLILIGINNPRCAEILPYAPSGIRKYKSVLAKKVGVSGTDMRSDLIKLVY